MNRLPVTLRRWAFALSLMSALSLAGCAAAPSRSENLPPLLGKDEVVRPYDKVADIKVSRERYGFPENLTTDDYNWAHHALRKEAARIGADAVILNGVNVDLQTYTIFPTSEMTAKGIAIKFR